MCFSPGGGIGRHKGLKIPRRQLRAGSSPALGTNKMNDNHHSLQPQELSIKLFVEVFLSLRKKIIIYSIIILCSSSLFSVFLPNQFVSTATISANKNSSNINSPFDDFGGISSVIGLGIESENTSDFQIALEKIQSRSFIEPFINDGFMKQKLLYALKWDLNEEKFIFEANLYDEINNKWLIDIPTDFKIYKEFKKNLSISKKGAYGLVELSFQSKSPALSKDVVQKIINHINKSMSEESLRESELNLNFLYGEISNQKSMQTKNAISKLIESQLQKKMLATNKENYVVKVVSPPLMPEEKSSPWRLGIIISSLLIFNFLYITFNIFLVFYRRN